MATVNVYTTGSIKQNTDGTVALCTSLSNLDTSGGHDWLCHATGAGAWYATTGDVDAWPDLYAAP